MTIVILNGNLNTEDMLTPITCNGRVVDARNNWACTKYMGVKLDRECITTK